MFQLAKETIETNETPKHRNKRNNRNSETIETAPETFRDSPPTEGACRRQLRQLKKKQEDYHCMGMKGETRGDKQDGFQGSNQDEAR